MEGLHEPRWDAPIDLDAHLRLLPPDAAARGMFFVDLLDRAQGLRAPDLFAAAGVAQRRFVPFLLYPYTDYLRLLVEVARRLHPEVSIGEAVRRIGRTAYDTLLGSHAGRVLFGVFGLNVEQVLAHGPRGWKLGLNFGSVASERVADRHFFYRFRNMAALLETYQAGVLEGAMIHCGVTPQLRVRMAGLASADFDVTW